MIWKFVFEVENEKDLRRKTLILQQRLNTDGFEDVHGRMPNIEEMINHVVSGALLEIGAIKDQKEVWIRVKR